MSRTKIYFVTGNDTGVGKTVVTTLLVRYLLDRGEDVMAVKPYCSGGRDDARKIRAALGNRHSLDEINPWHFRAALAPVIAARREGVRLRKADCVRFLQNAAKTCDVLIIEGAGGLLSPMGEGFDSRDLIELLDAIPIIVCPNRLGAINQVRLVMAGLGPPNAARSQVVLKDPPRKNVVSNSNPEMLQTLLPDIPINLFPWLGKPDDGLNALRSRQVQRALAQCLEGS